MDYESVKRYGTSRAQDTRVRFAPGPDDDQEAVCCWEDDTYSAITTLITTITGCDSFYENKPVWRFNPIAHTLINLSLMGFPERTGRFFLDQFVRLGPARQRSYYPELLLANGVNHTSMLDFWDEFSNEFKLDNPGNV